MVSPVYRLPDNVPIVWTSPTSLQVGIDPPLAHLSDIPDNATPLLHALTRGTPPSGLSALAKVHHVTDDWVSHLISSLSPAFDTTPPVSAPTWEVWSSSEAITGISAHAKNCGVKLTVPPRIDHTTTPTQNVVVLVADYLVHPHWADWLLRQSTTHCPVIFSDQTVTIGPVVTPGESPCLVCLELWRRDDTPGWLEVSSQLWGTTSPLHTQRPVGMAWALLYLLLTPGGTAERHPGHTQAVFRVDSDTVSFRNIEFHPHCTCTGLHAE